MIEDPVVDMRTQDHVWRPEGELFVLTRGSCQLVNKRPDGTSKRKLFAAGSRLLLNSVRFRRTGGITLIFIDEDGERIEAASQRAIRLVTDESREKLSSAVEKLKRSVHGIRAAESSHSGESLEQYEFGGAFA